MELPFIDEHRVRVSAPASAVWHSLGAYLGRPSGAGPLAHLVGTRPRRASGHPLTEGATLPGFLVAESVPDHLLRLTGRHRFSTYELAYIVDSEPDFSVLRARSYAVFPGPHGWAYETMVIRSGAHRVVVRRMLHAIARGAERTPA